MPDSQTAHILIMSILLLSEPTVKLIHATVEPLTCKGVEGYLRMYEQHHDCFTNAIQAAHEVASANSVKKATEVRCTESISAGPHPEKECWSKPEN